MIVRDEHVPSLCSISDEVFGDAPHRSSDPLPAVQGQGDAKCPDSVDVHLVTWVDLATKEVPIALCNWNLTMSFGDVGCQCKCPDARWAFSRIHLFKSAALGPLSWSRSLMRLLTVPVVPVEQDPR